MGVLRPVGLGGGAPMISLSGGFTPCRAGGGRSYDQFEFEWGFHALSGWGGRAPMISLSLSGGFTPCRAGGGGRSYDQFEFE